MSQMHVDVLEDIEVSYSDGSQIKTCVLEAGATYIVVEEHIRSIFISAKKNSEICFFVKKEYLTTPYKKE